LISQGGFSRKSEDISPFLTGVLGPGAYMRASAIRTAGWMDKRNRSYSVRANLLVTGAAVFFHHVWRDARF
jgi:hypothetical protein